VRLGAKAQTDCIGFAPYGAPQLPTPPKPDITLEAPGDRFTFISYGDIRFMDVSDTRHTNPIARVAHVEKIAKEKPVFVTISGDFVYREPTRSNSCNTIARPRSGAIRRSRLYQHSATMMFRAVKPLRLRTTSSGFR